MNVKEKIKESKKMQQKPNIFIQFTKYFIFKKFYL